MNAEASSPVADATVSTVTASANNVLALAPHSKVKRQTKKDFFAGLPSTLSRSDKERKFAQYATQFSAQEMAALSGAVAAGLVRVTRSTMNASGKSGSLGFEVVRENETRISKREQALADEVERLKAELAAKTTDLVPATA